MKYIILKLIRLYQLTISPDHGWRYQSSKEKGFHKKSCRFSPTCSEYTYTAVEKYGSIKGGILGMWRIFRCNPHNTPKMETYEPIPETFKLINLNHYRKNGSH